MWVYSYVSVSYTHLGYKVRHTLSVEEIGSIIQAVKAVRPDVICMVDNCYGEFTEVIEPTNVGADLCVGSLIKNLGGGLAPIGGYIVGRKDLIERCAVRLTAPGLGKEQGPTLGVNRSLYQGLFQAPEMCIRDSSWRAYITTVWRSRKAETISSFCGRFSEGLETEAMVLKMCIRDSAYCGA